MATSTTPRHPKQWLPVITAAAEATQLATEECIAVLERDGETQAALVLRRHFNVWPANHEHRWNSDECVDCGGTR